MAWPDRISCSLRVPVLARRRCSRCFVAIVLALTPVFASALDLEVGAPEGAVQTAFAERARDGYNLPVASFSGDQAPTRLIEGKVRWTAYRLPGQPGTAAVIDGYRDWLVDQGFQILLDCETSACGGFDFRFGVDMLAPPDMRMDVRDFAQLSLERLDPPGVVSILASSVPGAVFIQTVSVIPSIANVNVEPSADNDLADDGSALLQEDRAIVEALQTVGHVRIDGLDFATGGARLVEGADPVLDRLARVLGRDGALRVAIVGHSDNQGGLEPNIALSQRRAQAVLEALVSRGVARSQLEARGIGYLAPIASNSTKEGRARNRRVELVLR